MSESNSPSRLVDAVLPPASILRSIGSLTIDGTDGQNALTGRYLKLRKRRLLLGCTFAFFVMGPSLIVTGVADTAGRILPGFGPLTAATGVAIMLLPVWIFAKELRRSRSHAVATDLDGACKTFYRAALGKTFDASDALMLCAPVIAAPLLALYEKEGWTRFRASNGALPRDVGAIECADCGSRHRYSEREFVPKKDGLLLKMAKYVRCETCSRTVCAACAARTFSLCSCGSSTGGWGALVSRWARWREEQGVPAPNDIQSVAARTMNSTGDGLVTIEVALSFAGEHQVRLHMLAKNLGSRWILCSVEPGLIPGAAPPRSATAEDQPARFACRACGFAAHHRAAVFNHIKTAHSAVTDKNAEIEELGP
jgi:hypothetical protein